MNRALLRLALSLAWLLPLWGVPAATARAQGETVSIGVLTFRPLAQAQQQWRPLVDYLNRQIPEARFVLTVYGHLELQDAIQRQVVDLLITQPADYVRHVHSFGLLSALATIIPLERGQPVRAMGGVILVPSHRDDINTLADLRNRRIAITFFDSLGAYQAQAYELAKAGVKPLSFLETGNPQDRTVQAMLGGQADAAFVRTGLMETMVSEGRLKSGQVKVLNSQRYPGYPNALSTRLYPEWPVVAMPHLKEDIAVRIAGALLSIPHGSPLTRSLGLHGFTTPADYEPVRATMRELRLPPFDTPVQVAWADIWHQYRYQIGAFLLSLGVILLMAMRELWLRQRIASFSNAMSEGMFVLDRQGRASYVNRAASHLLGAGHEALLGQHIIEKIVSAHPHSYLPDGRHPLRDPKRWQESFVGESVFVNARGESFPVEVSIRPVHRKGRFVRSVVVFSDISERKAHSEHIYQLAYHDGLTGLPNRRLLQDRLHDIVANNPPDSRGALLFMDLDRFKQINDALGHKVGDALLQAVAKRVAHVTGTQGLVAHTGGDEFAVLLQDLGDGPLHAHDTASSLANRLCRALREPFGIGKQYHQISVSIGVVLFEGRDIQADLLLKRADMAMYEAKASGRNTVRFFDHDMEAALSQRVALEAELQRALQAQQFEVYYQPQVDSTGRIVGAEALLRWRHPQRGLVMPGKFIPLAEETGLILPLGQWVLEQVCAQIEQWRGHPVLGQLEISVNLCAHQLMQANFVESVTSVLMASGADASKLQLELTESVLADNVEEIIRKMRQLVDLGVKFSLDDFGTGYSSLSYLKRLPMAQLKIDASFVRDLQTDANDVAITQTIIELGRSLDLEVIAEGVETEAQRDILLMQGCGLFQGYLFARPMPLDQFVERVQNPTPTRA